jgi:hypothetical protein
LCVCVALLGYPCPAVLDTDSPGQCNSRGVCYDLTHERTVHPPSLQHTTLQEYVQGVSLLPKVIPSEDSYISTRVMTLNVYKTIIIMALQPFVGPWPLLQFLDPIHIRYDSFNGGSACREASLPTHRTTQTQNKHTQYRQFTP